MREDRIFIKIFCILLSFIFIVSLIIPIVSNASSLNDNAKKVVLNSVEDIEKNIDENKYPGYKEKLLKIKNANPNWKITLYYTGIDWNTVIANESTGYHSRSLVQNKSGEWICKTCGTKVYDKGGWMCASTKAVAYLMDVRNCLTESYIFQFEELSYNPNTYTIEGIEKILNGTFMYNKSIRDYYNNDEMENITFSRAIMEAASISGVSPYHLASRMRQELGVNGSNSIYGTYNGYEGYYNFYNICAYSGEDPIGNGLKFASDTTIGKYLLPWDDPVKAIKGGAIWIAKNYISAGQDTLYFEKYDVVNNGTSLYTHQYMQNIFAAKNEGYTTYKAYKNLGLLDNNFNFIIPVYENMPKTLSEEPQNTISELNETVYIKGENVILRQEPTTSSNLIKLLSKNTEVTRIQKSVAYANGYYWDKIKLSDGTIGYIATNYISLTKEITTNQETTVNNNISNSNVKTIENTITVATEEKKVESVTETKNTQTLEKVKVNQKNVILRKSPTTSSKKLKKLSKNTVVTRLEKNVKKANGYYWDKVKLSNGTVGYIASKYLSSIGTTSTSSNNSTSTASKAKINQNKVNLRKSPTTSSKKIKTLSKNTTVTIIQRKVKKANGYYWDKVKLSNGTVGYVASKYLS